MRLRILFFMVAGLVVLPSCRTPNTGVKPEIVRGDSAKINSSFPDSLSKRTFYYFWDLAGTDNGQIPDRWPTQQFSSIAATGFGLTAYLVGVDRDTYRGSRQQTAY